MLLVKSLKNKIRRLGKEVLNTIEIVVIVLAEPLESDTYA
jgi:hypothetical protein